MRRSTAYLALVMVLLAGCAPADPEPTPEPPGSSAAGPTEYRDGLSATIDLPTGTEPTAVVVLVPGGGWSSADPGGLAPLAAALAEDGLAVVTITYGTSGTDAFYPTPVDDVRCAVAFAAAQVPGVPVVLVGHSAGAQLVALVGLVPEPDPAGARDCAYPDHAADAVVGLAGPYDVTRTGGLARNLFGVGQDEDAELWAAGNPLTWVDERPDVPYLLVHGESDSDVPTAFTSDFAALLDDAGHDVTVELVPGADHGDIYQPGTVGELLIDWIDGTVLAGP
ncbi:alpha/beta fold hydrolase [Cellulomonas sp. KRMCY2]|uniref:alpha/beta fold hydrolase n=1 Tax=Cellulomonas sp. KRMCY2 TaxID=1304865 RepID=UPI00045EA3AE|nr:alpha/beta fold hydrolase [Cellulomonas sp. KRMCY2]